MILTPWVMAFYAVVVFGLSSVSFSFKFIPGRCDKRIAFFFCSSDLVPTTYSSSQGRRWKTFPGKTTGPPISQKSSAGP